MTAAVFIVVWLLSLAWYGAYGPFLWAGGPTIYLASMWAVLATAAAFAILRSRVDAKPLAAVGVVAAVILYGWYFGWKFGPPGALHMLAHLILGCGFLWFARERWQDVIGFLFLAGAAMSAGAVLGLWPARPRVFTGLYYADAVAYMTHAALIVIGRAAHDDFGIGRRLRPAFARRRWGIARGGAGSVAISPSDQEKAGLP